MLLRPLWCSLVVHAGFVWMIGSTVSGSGMCCWLMFSSRLVPISSKSAPVVLHERLHERPTLKDHVNLHFVLIESTGHHVRMLWCGSPQAWQ